jgi:hypothetical protein
MHMQHVVPIPGVAAVPFAGSGTALAVTANTNANANASGRVGCCTTSTSLDWTRLRLEAVDVFSRPFGLRTALRMVKPTEGLV